MLIVAHGLQHAVQRDVVFQQALTFRPKVVDKRAAAFCSQRFEQRQQRQFDACEYVRRVGADFGAVEDGGLHAFRPSVLSKSFKAHFGVALRIAGVGLPLVFAADQHAGAVIAVSRVADLIAACFDPLAQGAAEVQQVAEAVRRDLVKVLQDQLAQIALQQGIRGQVARTAALVDAVGDGQKRLCPRDAARHCVGEEHVATLWDHRAKLLHDLTKRACETGGAHFAAAVDRVPVQLELLPVVQRHRGQHIGRGLPALGGVHVKAGHQGDVDDLAAKVFLCCSMFLVGQGTQRPVIIATTDGDANHLHACGFGGINQAGRVAASEKLAEQNEDIAFAEHGILRDVGQRNRLLHCAYPLNLLMIIEPLVPPKPKLLVITLSSPAFSTNSVAISPSLIAGSKFSTLIDGAMKSLSSISRQ